MTRPRVLLLAGTAEATELANLLAGRGTVHLVASLARGTSDRAALPCPVRIGGFGGMAGLAEELRGGGYAALVDATHPFSARIPVHAAEAAALVGIPRLRLLRPAWSPAPPTDWLDANDVEGAATLLPAIGARRVLLTTGRRYLEPFAGLAEIFFVVRSIEPADLAPLANAVSITARPPFTVEDERALLATHGIDTLVTRNSGGPDAKLVAAGDAGVRVVMVRRPPAIPGPTAGTAGEALRWLAQWTCP